MITVLLFGPVADRAGIRQVEFDFAPGLRLQELHDTLQARYPEAFALVSMTAVNGAQVRDMSNELPDHSEVVFMSKFSGG
jgi:molybdopterin synthase sulfur carrier subunit